MSEVENMEATLSFDELADEIIGELQSVEARSRDLIAFAKSAVETPSPRKNDMIANATLALRHIEDAVFRITMSSEAFKDGGVAIGENADEAAGD